MGVVGSAEPGPISNSIDAATTKAATQAANVAIGIERGGAMRFHVATATMNDPPVSNAERRSATFLSAGPLRKRRRDAASNAASDAAAATLLSSAVVARACR